MEHFIFLNDKPKEHSQFALYDKRRCKYLTYDPVQNTYNYATSIANLKIWDYQYLANAELWVKEELTNKKNIYIKEISSSKLP